MALDSWTIDNYKKQWQQAIVRLKTHQTSCLVASATELQKKPQIHLWTLYKEDETIFIRSQALGGDMLQKKLDYLPPFAIDTCYLYIPSNRQMDFVDGFYPDEWHIKTEDFFSAWGAL